MLTDTIEDCTDYVSLTATNSRSPPPVCSWPDRPTIHSAMACSGVVATLVLRVCASRRGGAPMRHVTLARRQKADAVDAPEDLAVGLPGLGRRAACGFLTGWREPLPVFVPEADQASIFHPGGAVTARR